MINLVTDLKGKTSQLGEGKTIGKLISYPELKVQEMLGDDEIVEMSKDNQSYLVIDYVGAQTQQGGQ
jgi:hypothetical protein